MNWNFSLGINCILPTSRGSTLHELHTCRQAMGYSSITQSLLGFVSETHSSVSDRFLSDLCRKREEMCQRKQHNSNGTTPTLSQSAELWLHEGTEGGRIKAISTPVLGSHLSPPLIVGGRCYFEFQDAVSNELKS